MDDETNSTYIPTQPYFQKYWLICESLLCILTIIAIYLAACLTKHAMKKKDNSQTGSGNCHKTWLNVLCAVASVGFVVRLGSNHVSAFLGWKSDDLCFITVTVSTVLYCLSIYPIYYFLWVRQSIFYTNAVIKKQLNPFVIKLSWFLLGFMTLTGIAMTVLYAMPQVTGWSFTATERGCIDDSEDSAEIVPAIVVVCTIIFQIMLLGLFVYPLHSKTMERFRSPGGSRTNKTDNYHSSTLSKSEEQKRYKKDEIDDDDAFYQGPSRPASPFVKPISPLAVNEIEGHTNFSFEGTTRASETDNESVPDGMEWIDRPVQSVKGGKINIIGGKKVQYRGRSAGQSVSSDCTASPAISDSEQTNTRSKKFNGTLKSIRSRFRRGSHDEKNNNKEARKLVTLMKHYAKLMTICVITDAVAAFIQIAFVLPELVYLVLYDITLLINSVCMVLTFKEWPKILRVSSWKLGSRKHSTFSSSQLRRKPTPLRRATRDRVEELKREERPGSPFGRRSSGSGYESGDSATHIYRPVKDYGRQMSRNV